MLRFWEKLLTDLQKTYIIWDLCAMHGPNNWLPNLPITSSELCKKELMRCWHDQLKWAPLWNELWLRYKVTLLKRTHEMLAWSTEMNTIMKGILTKILGHLGQKISQSEKNSSLFKLFIIFTKKSTKLKISFSTFATCFLIFCKSILTPSFLLKIITSIILVWNYKISEQENIIIEPWPLLSFYFSNKNYHLQ